MKSIEIFNETNSNLNKAVNMAFEVTLRKIEEASKVGRTHIQEDFQSAEIKDGVSNYLDELIQEAVKDGEFQVTFECENSDLTDRVITELKKNGYN